MVLGYDDLGSVSSDWVQELLPDELVTLGAIPGAEYTLRFSPKWGLKPFFQLGVGRDFSVSETIYFGTLAPVTLSCFNPIVT